MSQPTPKLYRFYSAAHWQQCLTTGFDPTPAGQLAPTRQLGAHAVQITAQGPLTLIAADPYNRVIWRRQAAVEWLNELGDVSGPFAAEGFLEASPRWIFDREALWAINPDSPRLGKFDRETLQSEFTLDLAALGDAGDDRPEAALDLASDGRDGVWILVRQPEHRYGLIHIDCRGRCRGRLQIPCKTGAIAQIACVSVGASLVLLERAGTEIWLIDTTSGAVQRSVLFDSIHSRWTATRLSADGRNRVMVGGNSPSQHGSAWSLLQFDAALELRDGPLTNLFVDTLEHPGAISTLLPHDLAVCGDTVWFAGPNGLWRLDSSDACGARESTAMVLTPALRSPLTGALRGWLRAEVDIDLTAGAVLTAEIVSTSDTSLAGQLQLSATNAALPSAARQQSIWASLAPVGAPISITGPTDPGQPVSIPLFATQDEWLWLRLTLMVPPDGQLPTLRELRVYYPEISINQYLPAFFRGPDGDTANVLRRLVGVLEATTQGLDAEIAAIGAHIDPTTADAPWLDYLGRWMQLPWDDGLPEAAKQSILQSAGALLAARGTRAGLSLLLQSLLGPGAAMAIVDTVVDLPLTPLGGRGRPGARLPLLLTGAAPGVAILDNGKARLGHARLACNATDCNPLRSLAPTVRLLLSAGRDIRSAVQPILASLLAQYLPAGLQLAVRWVAHPDNDLGTGLTLDADGPRHLGDDSILGHTLLGGRARGRLGEGGLILSEN